ncbi:hypothetical protein FS837_002963 [Tulasnella sp. UAMH 9824]|nr:hypothetical protein FS837_002963 [Tulasnella sp. UAMH 9824]
MAAANYKAAHYEHELNAALCRGAWAESSPAKTHKGVAISWSELLRKHQKHCKANGLTTVAQETRDLSLLLVASGPTPTSFSAADFDFDCSESENVFNRGEEYILFSERQASAKQILATLLKADATDDGVLLARAYVQFAIKDSKDCLETLSRIDFDGPTPSISATGSNLSAPGSAFNSLGTSSGLSALEAAISRTGSLAGSVGLTELSKRLEAEVGEGTVWHVTERIRGRCLQGMAYERSMNWKSALASYDSGITLLDRLAISRTTPQGKTKIELFTKYRELWRWAERTLRGAVILSARASSMTETLRYLRLYSIYSYHWPSTFRPYCRSAIYTLHMRALCLTPPGIEPREPSALSKQAWRDEARRLASEMKVLLENITEFPRAGEVNHRVLDFVDLCVAAWEKGGFDETDAGWVIDALWWSTRLTFHSHRVMRHLSHLLLIQDNLVTARRTFELYVRLVDKSRQTAGGDISLQLKRRPTHHPPAAPSAIVPQVADEEGLAEDELRGSGVDADSDRTFVHHLIWGVSMLAKFTKSHTDAKEVQGLAKLANEVLRSNEYLLEDHVLVAKVARAEGIAFLVLAQREPDPKLRPKHQLTALERLQESVKLDPNAAGTFYHLAIAQAETRDIPEAVLSARAAVEKNPAEIRSWHLLGLLLTAQGDWNGAKAVFELGLAHADDPGPSEGDGGTATPTIDGLPQSGGLLAKDFALKGGDGTGEVIEGLGTSAASALATPTPERPNPFPEASPAKTLLPTTLILPPSKTLLAPPPDTPRPTTSDKFEASLQLRITQLALTELVDGSDMSNLMWPEIFAFFSDRCPSGIGHSPQPTGGTDTRAHSHIGTVVPTAPSTAGNPSLHTTSESAQQPDDPHRRSMDATTSSGSRQSQADAPRLGRLIPPSPGPGDQPGRARTSDSTDENDGEENPDRHQKVHRQTSLGVNGGNLPKRILHKSQRQMHSLGKRVTSEARKLDDFMDGSMGKLNKRLQRSSSAPDFHNLMVTSKSYQASSIHSRSRFRMKSLKLKGVAGTTLNVDMNEEGDEPRPFSPPPPLPPPASPTSKRPQRETRLLSDLWLTSAATFRRMGKLEQAKAAIQEAEVLDETNPGVWVQLGLYHSVLGHDALAIESLHKALVIEQDHVAALVHLAQQYLKPPPSLLSTPTVPSPLKENVDLAAGLLTGLTQGQGWDVPEAWYFLAKACGLQGRKERERECLIYSLQLQESRCLRPVGVAVPRCL